MGDDLISRTPLVDQIPKDWRNLFLKHTRDKKWVRDLKPGDTLWLFSPYTALYGSNQKEPVKARVATLEDMKGSGRASECRACRQSLPEMFGRADGYFGQGGSVRFDILISVPFEGQILTHYLDLGQLHENESEAFRHFAEVNNGKRQRFIKHNNDAEIRKCQERIKQTRKGQRHYEKLLKRAKKFGHEVEPIADEL